MSNNKKDLAPCPFCGGEALVSNHDDDWGKPMYTVGCYRCDANVMIENYYDLDVALTLWNHRPHEAQIKADAVRDFGKHLGELMTVPPGKYASACNLAEQYADQIQRGEV